MCRAALRRASRPSMRACAWNIQAQFGEDRCHAVDLGPAETRGPQLATQMPMRAHASALHPKHRCM